MNLDTKLKAHDLSVSLAEGSAVMLLSGARFPSVAWPALPFLGVSVPLPSTHSYVTALDLAEALKRRDHFLIHFYLASA